MPRPRTPGGHAPLPTEYGAQLATLVKAAPNGAAWVHEPKYDGYRMGCRIERGEVRLISRRGNDWTARLPELAEAARRLPVTTALLDGELVVFGPDGRTSFQALQETLGGGSRRGLAYVLFDLLHLDGRELAREPLDERKRALAALLGDEPPPGLRYSTHLEGRGEDVLREACRLGLEGIVSKRRDLPHRAGRSAGWLKVKCHLRQELVIGGFTEPGGGGDAIAALLVGVHDGEGRLRYAGKVGTGYTHALARSLHARLGPLRRPASPFVDPPGGVLRRTARWVRPDLVAEVEFTEWTRDGKVRHPSFQGLREDKRPGEVLRERPAEDPALPAEPPPPSARPSRTRARADEVQVAGVRISHPERVVFPDVGVTKLDLARYYEAIADAVVPHLAGRPLTLVRCRGSIDEGCAYMKHSKVWAPAPLRRVRIPEKTKVGEYLVADDLAAVVGLVQMDAIELHTWNARADHVEQPDRLVFDLDPGPEVSWGDVVAAARLVRDALRALRLESWVKTTGGAGLHVVAPIAPRPRWDRCLAFARAVAEVLVRERPETFTTALKKAGRERKLLLDYLRNNRTNTSVAAFSVRARPGARVSTPLSWDELTPRLRPERFTVRSVPARVRRLGADPWAGYFASRQELTPTQLAAVGVG